MRYPALILLAIMALALFNLISAQRDRVMLQDIKLLVLREGRMTTSRRSAPVPQLSKRKGPHAGVTEVVCKNEGHDGTDVVWKCTPTNIETGYSLSGAEVSCEGFSNPDDPYVLKGSCGLEYDVIKVGGGSSYYSQNYKPQQHVYDSHDDSNSESTVVGSFFKFILYFIVGSLLFFAFIGCCRGDSSRSSGGGSWFGGGGGDGGDGASSGYQGYRAPSSAPPPYPGTGSDSSNNASCGPGPRMGTYSQTYTQTQPPPTGGIGSGIGSFFSNPLVSGGLGYLLGRSTAFGGGQHTSNFDPTSYQQRTYYQPRPSYGFGGGYSSGYSGGGGSSVSSSNSSGSSYATTKRR